MAVDPTERVEFAKMRLLTWVTGLTLANTPRVYAAEQPDGLTGGYPAVRVSFDEVPPQPRGRFNATKTALSMSLLMTCDIIYQHPDIVSSYDLYAPDRTASDLRSQMQFLELGFLDYTVPASPVAVSDCVLRIRRVEVREPRDDNNIRRRLVRGTVEWIARSEDYFA